RFGAHHVHVAMGGQLPDDVVEQRLRHPDAETCGGHGADYSSGPSARAPAGMRGGPVPTSPHWARWRRAWSIGTRATIASAIGVARMPTQGSWRPVVMTSTGLPCTSTVGPGRRRLEVGLSAIEATTCWPVEMPPRMPPAWLLAKPAGPI